MRSSGLPAEEALPWLSVQPTTLSQKSVHDLRVVSEARNSGAEALWPQGTATRPQCEAMPVPDSHDGAASTAVVFLSV